MFDVAATGATFTGSSARIILVGSCKWYSKEELEEKPSVLKSCSEYSPPSGFLNWVCRLWGIDPSEK
jgi:hypothetical protein